MGNKSGKAKMKNTPAEGEGETNKAQEQVPDPDANNAVEAATVDLDDKEAPAGGEDAAKGEDSAKTEVTVSTEFRWEGPGETVEVGGSFNNWGDNKPMEKKDDVFTLSLDLVPGEYIFKYFVDGEWQVNKDQPTKAEDDGTENNVVVVVA